MPKFNFEVTEAVTYSVDVEAESQSAAREKLEELLADGAELDLTEKDTSDLEITWPPADDEIAGEEEAA